ncbi:MAG: phosphoglycerate mutase family protein [Streptococcaceae bacterium]|jgi:probable phosphoglycerate mutase|nr:phosphoglycerate mutase family protein [Streptococcaceae bacterium]
MKKTLYLMRHGQTQFNVLRKIQGWIDSPLTEEGMNQAKRVREYFEENNITFDQAYCSTAERASDTLEIVTNYQMPYTRLKGLKEKGFGRYEGESEDLHPNFDIFHTYYEQFGGETTQQATKRVSETVHEIMQKDGHENVLIVSHGGASAMFLASVLHLQPEDFSAYKKQYQDAFSNCGMIRYSYEDGVFVPEEVIAPNLQLV